MSWATNKAVVTALMTGYTEIPDNLTVGEQGAALVDKGFSLKPVEMPTEFATSNVEITEDVGELLVGYSAKDNAEYDSKYDDWKTLLSAIKGGHYGYAEQPKFERMPNDTHYVKASVKLFVGVVTS
jgi:hypothetical protein